MPPPTSLILPNERAEEKKNLNKKEINNKKQKRSEKEDQHAFRLDEFYELENVCYLDLSHFY